MNERPSKKEAYLEAAAALAKRSACKRRKYGAIIVKDDRVIGWGYNGAPRGEAHCAECARAGLPHNSKYADDCPAVHAETNALIAGNGAEFEGADMYIAGWEMLDTGEMRRIEDAKPCVQCMRNIKNARIARVICGVSE